MWNKKRVSPFSDTDTMNEFYYLNAKNTPEGPHSLDELATMMAQGRINPTTLVACKGGSSWEPLGSILSREHMSAPELKLESGQVGHCPSCGYDLAANLQNNQLPADCPLCSRALSRPGIWRNFCLVLRNYARFSGRATRAEFWSFQLVNFLIIMAIYMTLVISVVMLAGVHNLVDADSEQEIETAIAAALESDSSVALGIVVIVSVLALIAWSFFTFIPQLSATVRRLHDLGWSGKWLLLYFVICALNPGILLVLSGSQATAEGGADIVSTLWWVNYLASHACGIFLFVLMLLDSKRGPNKYGPSTKYPLG